MLVLDVLFNLLALVAAVINVWVQDNALGGAALSFTDFD
jgi:hypothetical protein